MKGISIAIETIIYIILGVTVLAVLLFFFTSVGGQSQKQVQMEFQRNNACGQYVSYDPKCDNTGTFPSTSTVKEGILKKIGEACEYLKVDKCVSGGASIECVQNCCIGCAR